MILEAVLIIYGISLSFLLIKIISGSKIQVHLRTNEEEPLLPELTSPRPRNRLVKFITCLVLFMVGISCITGFLQFSFNLRDGIILLCIDHLMLIIWLIIAIIVLGPNMSGYYHSLFIVNVLSLVSQSVLVVYWVLTIIDLPGKLL
jgi:hypothetical protein